MSRWIKRIVLALVIAAIVLVLVWSMWPRPAPVEAVAIVRGALKVTVDEDGRARVQDRYVVTAPLAGTLARVELRPGDRVAAGAVVARVAPMPAPLLDARTRSELTGRVGIARAQRRQSDATVGRAQTASEFAHRELERIRVLVQREALPAVELERLQLQADMAARDLQSARFAASVASHEVNTAEAMLARLSRTGPARDGEIEVASPIEGQVLRVMTQSEGAVAPGTPIVELGDPRRLEIVADVLTADAVAIRPGAAVTIDAWGGPPLAGKVRRIEPSATTRMSALGVEEQRVDVLIDLASPPAAWTGLGDGWRVEVRITTWEAADVVTVPLGALFRDGDTWAVYVVADERAHTRKLELGRRSSTAAEVVRGLAPGERVILHPGERISDGVRVQPR